MLNVGSVHVNRGRSLIDPFDLSLLSLSSQRTITCVETSAVASKAVPTALLHPPQASLLMCLTFASPIRMPCWTTRKSGCVCGVALFVMRVNV